MKKLLAILLFSVSGHVLAQGELFALQTTGTEYCPGSAPLRFTPSTDIPFFVRFDSETSVSAFVWSVGSAPDFTFDTQVDFISTRALSFNADNYLDSDNHMEVIGRIKLDKYGVAKTLTGTFIRVGMTNSCYSVGKLTGKRIN